MRYRFTKDDITISRNNNGTLILSIMIDGHYVDHCYMFYSKAEAIRKFQEQFGTYPDDYKPAGVLPMNNFGGLAIMEIEHGIEDYLYVCDNYGDGYKNITKNKIRYNARGNAYFMRYGKRYYLDQFMRVA